MRHFTVLTTCAVVAGALTLLAWLSAPAVSAQEQVTPIASERPAQIMAQSASGSFSGRQEQPLTETASGAVEDTLTACLSRIPRDASAGQRLIAEESCKRDKAERTPMDAVPGS